MLPINKNVNYQSVQGDTIYELSLKRINFTNIDYQFSINDQLGKSGQVVLPAGFILGAEFSEIDNENAIALTQYFDKIDCWTCIKIELGTGNRVEFYLHCDNDSRKNFENIPILTKNKNANASYPAYTKTIYHNQIKLQ